DSVRLEQIAPAVQVDELARRDRPVRAAATALGWREQHGRVRLVLRGQHAGRADSTACAEHEASGDEPLEAHHRGDIAVPGCLLFTVAALLPAGVERRTPLLGRR